MINIYMENGMTVSGADMHHADGRRRVRVHIVHQPEDGYRSSCDGTIIREQLNLYDFIKRLTTVKYYNRPLNQSIDQYVTNNVREILIVLDRNGSDLQRIVRELDRVYAGYIKERKIVLPQHNYSMEQGPAIFARESMGSEEQSVQQSSNWNVKKVMQHMKEQGLPVMENPMTPDQAFKIATVNDDEIYYTLTS